MFNSDDDVCFITRDFDGGYENFFSAFTAAEMTRRLVLHSDVREEHRFPNLTLDDVLQVLYGAEQSELFPGLEWGGMTADTAIFVQGGLNISEVEVRSKGQWRIFSKLGAGYSISRERGEVGQC